MAVMVVPVVIVYHAIEKGTRSALLSEQLQHLQELRQTQAQLVESAKMASLGTLSAGVAHEINNPVFAIRGRADLLLSRAEEHLRSQKALHHVQVIREMSDRVSKVVRALLSFARESEDQEEIELQQAVEDSLSLAGGFSASHNNIQIIKDYPFSPVVAKGSFSKLEQVFLNLILNARDAMPQGGCLTVQIRGENSTAQVLISDTGVGIPSENLGRIFDPFFTTKEVGRGTGLGLFIARGIVQEHGGTITVESELGKGSTFIVSLPCERAKTLSDEPPRTTVVSGSSSRSPVLSQ